MLALALFDGDLSLFGGLILLASLAVAFGFEFINGFHDAANAVATVIYTNSLKPWQAVALSGVCNFLGVLLGGVAVAYAIVHLLPVELLVNMGQTAGLLMVLSLLVSAIIWNFGTWYLGLPASSSHTLIGSILGVGLAASLFTGHGFGSGVNWHKAGDVMLSLLISPVIGFAAAALLLFVAKLFIRHPDLYQPPVGKTPPPWWIRGILMLTCTGVSFAHGSNDGQKGIGLIMLILIGMVPSLFALNMSYSKEQIAQTVASIDQLQTFFEHRSPPGTLPVHKRVVHKKITAPDWTNVRLTPTPIEPSAAAIHEHLDRLRQSLVEDLTNVPAASLEVLPKDVRWIVHSEILQIRQALLDYQDRYDDVLTDQDDALIAAANKNLTKITEYAPPWVPMGVALALGIGTMIGWKRIVITVGEKIGKTHMTYAQGAAANLVAMCTIGIADLLGLPVSTTHVLSSGVAGTMAANRSGLQGKTIKHIALAWILTLPACMLLSALLFLATAANFMPKHQIAQQAPPPAVALMETSK